MLASACDRAILWRMGSEGRTFDTNETSPAVTWASALPFLITGLPRSRTGWLSVACTNPPAALCIHEPSADLPTWQAVAGIWSQPSRYRFLGISDSLLGFHLGWILENVRPRVLIVERNPADVENSMERAGFPRINRYCELLLSRMEPYFSDPLVKCIGFEELRNTASVAAAVQHLLPGATVDTLRLELLQRMNIQTDLDRVRAIAARRSGDAVALFGNDVGNDLLRVN